jgi:1,2-diacylglycerol 3-beta-glucosyltransferase
MLIGQRRIRRSQAAAQGYSSAGTTTAEAIETKPQFVFFGPLFRALYGTLYMLHWFPVMASTTARMAIRPNRLKWVKTVHYGAEESH